MEYQTMSDLFGNYRLFKGIKPLNERATLIKFFVDQGFQDKKTTNLLPSAIGVLLAHYSTDQLYALKSAYSDRLNRNGYVAACKYWWAVIRTKEVRNDASLP